MQLALYKRSNAERELHKEGQTHREGDGEAENFYPPVYVFQQNGWLRSLEERRFVVGHTATGVLSQGKTAVEQAILKI